MFFSLQVHSLFEHSTTSKNARGAGNIGGPYSMFEDRLSHQITFQRRSLSSMSLLNIAFSTLSLTFVKRLEHCLSPFLGNKLHLVGAANCRVFLSSILPPSTKNLTPRNDVKSKVARSREHGRYGNKVTPGLVRNFLFPLSHSLIASGRCREAQGRSCTVFSIQLYDNGLLGS